MLAAQKEIKTFSTIDVGSEHRISHFTDPYCAGKLLAMGILPGTVIRLVRKAPLGGGYYIKADNHLIALRKAEAECIVLK